MDTTFTNPTRVSGSQSVNENGFISPKGQTPVNQLEQRAANWEALEIVEPPPYGEPSSNNVLKVDSKRHTWPVYLVSVPEDWEPASCRTVPPNTQRYKSAVAAAEVARVLNQDRINRSKDGHVYNWHIRTKFNSKYAIISINVPHPWKPTSPHDMPPPFIFIDGPADECKRVIGELNEALFKEDASKRKRAYIGRSIHPEEIKQVEQPESDDGHEYNVMLSNGNPLGFRLSGSEALNLVSVWNQSRKYSEPEARAVIR